ncbi:MAG TPA: acyl carrier protein [Ruminococcaceae bacterium]|nr:acyl carrier protein [Oscillospiraceae bacterium]
MWRLQMDIFEKVRDIIADQLDIAEKDNITEASSITDDLGADSLDVVDLVMAIEDEFSVEIPEDEVENIKVVGDIVKYIEDKQ